MTPARSRRSSPSARLPRRPSAPRWRRRGGPRKRKRERVGRGTRAGSRRGLVGRPVRGLPVYWARHGDPGRLGGPIISHPVRSPGRFASEIAVPQPVRTRGGDVRRTCVTAIVVTGLLPALVGARRWTRSSPATSQPGGAERWQAVRSLRMTVGRRRSWPRSAGDQGDPAPRPDPDRVHFPGSHRRLRIRRRARLVRVTLDRMFDPQPMSPRTCARPPIRPTSRARSSAGARKGTGSS